MDIREHILRLLQEDGKLGAANIAMRLDLAEAEVAAQIAAMERENVIRGYQVVVDESAFEENTVRALIEVKVSPERDGGFDRVAKRISHFQEVSSVYLVSGGYDLKLEVHGSSVQEVAMFVASKLATIEGVRSTATHFLLKKYKESGKMLIDGEEYERLKVSP